MSIIVAIILGMVIGWAASKVMGRDHGMITYLVIGVVGSFLGSFVSRLFTGSDQSFLAFDAMGLFWAFVGSVILLGIVGVINGRGKHVTS